MNLYKNLGYDCLNTITIWKDFNEDDFEVIQKGKIAGYEFDIKRYKKNNILFKMSMIFWNSIIKLSIPRDFKESRVFNILRYKWISTEQRDITKN